MERHTVSLTDEELTKLREAYRSNFYLRLMQARIELAEAVEAIDAATDAYERTKGRS